MLFNLIFLIVVYYPSPTSNHNSSASNSRLGLLYIILFLHQTTTFRIHLIPAASCISSFSYIKPQPYPQTDVPTSVGRCISSFSYIKPQHTNKNSQFHVVVYHPFPTSNHNNQFVHKVAKWLYIILFLHQTTT